MLEAQNKVAALPLWKGRVQPQPLSGGITNVNFVVEDQGRKYVVRIGEDIREHQVMRFNELAASQAAAAAGISPDVIYAAPGVLVLDFVEGRTLAPEDLRSPAILERVLPVIKTCHRQIPQHLRGPVLSFWVFHVLRDYAHTLREGDSPRVAQLSDLLAAAVTLEWVVGGIELVFGHNDLLAANFIDDGDKIWLIDWDYAGFNSPLFDLGGLASNNAFSAAHEVWLLENYFQQPLDDQLYRRYRAMKCASLLRETMWSMVSEIHSQLDFDYPAYTEENLQRFQTAWRAFNEDER